MLHDIGMLCVANSILAKNDVLSESEYQKVKLHPRHGHNILCHVGIKDQVILDIALDHHERYDGSGYPRGLSEQRIPKHAMVISICNIFCALTMNRPYKSASTPRQALKTMKAEKKLFDPEIFQAFLELMSYTHLQEEPVEQKNVPAMVTAGNSAKIQELRNTLRSAQDDRNKLLKLHSVVTDSINNAFGEEKEELVAFRTELKDLLNSMFATVKPK
jgi:HD-GYP domain